MKSATHMQSEQHHQRPASEPDRTAPSTPDVQFVDNRPEVIAQRKLADAIHNSSYTLTQRQQLRGMFGEAAQLKGGPEEEALLQGQFNPVQRKGPDEELQMKTGSTSASPAQHTNHTGLPDNLKSGIESLSGLSMDAVRVHYNSSQPAQLNALAYAQGTDIHVAPGQEHHLPHEAWHVVQQARGRVLPTMQMKGNIPVNDDASLETEADEMGARALSYGDNKNDTIAKPINTPIRALQAKQPVRQFVYMQVAEQFEGNLGKYAFGHARSRAGADDALTAMKQVMQVNALSGTAGQVFGGDDPRYPGNVGRDAVRVLDAVTHGNLREKMTGFYNASLGPFKKLLSDRINGVGQWARNWAGGRRDLQDRGFNPQAITNISTRKEQITGDYYKWVPFSSKMKDLYVAPGDFKTRRSDDDLYRGQSISKTKEPRLEALEMTDATKLNALTVEGLSHLTMTEADLIGEHNATLGNVFKTSTYLKIKQALRELRTSRGDGSSQAIVLRHLSEVKKHTSTWLKDNTGEKDLVSDFRRIHGDAARKMNELHAVAQRAFDLLPEALKRDSEADEEELEWITDDTFTPFNPDRFRVDRSPLAGDQASFLGAAGGADAYALVIAKVNELHIAAGLREKVRALHELVVMTATWSGTHGGAADDRVIATANSHNRNDKVKKRVVIERLQRQLDKVYSATARTNNDMRVVGKPALDARLSLRERNFLMESNPGRFDVGGGNFDNTASLAWEEGGTRYKPNLENDWMNEAVNSLKMPVVSGPSGTTDRMFQSLGFLGNPADRYDFRLALLGWMLSSGDHSFHEIMAVAKTYGCVYVPGPKSYRNIAPLAEDELRVNVCLTPGYFRLFPDEADYHQTMDANGFALYNPILADMNRQTQHSPLLESQMGDNAATYNASHKPKLLRNVTAYTTTAYAIQNSVANDSKIVAMQKIKSMLTTARSHPALGVALAANMPFSVAEQAIWDRLSWAEKHMVMVLIHTPNVTAEQLYDEAVRHNEFTEEAMRLLPDYVGEAWRGQSVVSLTGNLSGFDLNSTFTINKFLSAAQVDTEADFYAKQSRGITTDAHGVEQAKWYSGWKAGVILHFQSQHAKIVDSVSINENDNVRDGSVPPGLSEVVFIPGTTFRVTAAPHAEVGKDSPVVDVAEV